MGNGISQGITGNGYALHCLFRKFQSKAKSCYLAEKWKSKAFIFARAICHAEFQEKCQQYHDGMRLRKGMPNYPFSLIEGVAGDVCFLSDILRDDMDV